MPYYVHKDTAYKPANFSNFKQKMKYINGLSAASSHGHVPDQKSINLNEINLQLVTIKQMNFQLVSNVIFSCSNWLQGLGSSWA